MYISKVYLSDNFIPDVTVDQFRRRVCGMEVTLTEHEHLEDAIKLADENIKEYIKANTTEHFMGIQVSSIEPEDSIPLVDQINSCKELKVLESYKLIVRNDEVLNAAYRKKLVELSNQ